MIEGVSLLLIVQVGDLEPLCSVGCHAHVRVGVSALDFVHSWHAHADVNVAP